MKAKNYKPNFEKNLQKKMPNNARFCLLLLCEYQDVSGADSPVRCQRRSQWNTMEIWRFSLKLRTHISDVWAPIDSRIQFKHSMMHQLCLCDAWKLILASCNSRPRFTAPDRVFPDCPALCLCVCVKHTEGVRSHVDVCTVDCYVSACISVRVCVCL